MRITLEPTSKHIAPIEGTHPKVVVEIPFDDLEMEEMIDHLIKPALLGMGFKNETIDAYFDGEE